MLGPDQTADVSRGKSGNRPADWLRRCAIERFAVRYRKLFQLKHLAKLQFERHKQKTRAPRWKLKRAALRKRKAL
ncbi:MAG: hypothetical protein IJL25_01125 [Clostridia bacterium]|nr:hypothetical protein [Clostridia bacterium]